MKLRFYCIPLALVLLCTALAIAVRFSFTDTNHSADLQGFTLTVTGGSSGNKEKAEKESLSSFVSCKELEERAGVIVRARFEGERLVAGDGLYSEVTVKQVYKGNPKLLGTRICVVEEIFVAPNAFSTGGRLYTPLREGNDYLLLLNPLKFHPERKLTDMQKREYVPVTKTALSVYRITPEKQEKIFSEDELTVTLGEMNKNNWDLATRNREDLKKYCQFREDLFIKYQIVP